MENENIISDMDKQQLNEIRFALEQTIVTKLEKAGIYNRSLSRVKSEPSLAGKLATGKYSSEAGKKKVQDLIGIRINLFFYEDINICEQIINETFKVDNWSKTVNKDNKFEAQKRNCVCKLPSKHVKKLSEEIWENPIDQTFEVQLRTILFEGWHEIEHDMRYKNKYGKVEKSTLTDVNAEATTEHENKLSRIMNSIIANLELCDWSMVEIYDNLAEEQIKQCDWQRAFQSKYRLNIVQSELDQKVIDYFNENREIARLFFNIEKEKVIDALLAEKGNPELTQNRLVYMINDSFIHDEFVEQQLLNIQYVKEKSGRVIASLEPLHSFNVYRQDMYIPENNYEEAVRIIYAWAVGHMGKVFNQMPEGVVTGTYETIGYKTIINYDSEKKFFNMDLQHISSIEAGLIWHVTAKIVMKVKGLKLSVRNICESYTPKNRAYNRPEFMRDIYSKVGIIDAGYMIKEDESIKCMDSEELAKLINDKSRKLPVIAVSRPKTMPEWAVDIDGYVINVKTLRKSLGGLCHFVRLEEAEILKLNESDIKCELGGVIYWKMDEKNPVVFNMKQIHESYFEETRHIVEEETQYEKAFRYLLKEMVREEFTGNV